MSGSGYEGQKYTVMTKSELQSYYTGCAEKLRSRIVLLRRRNRAFVAGEILSFLSGIAALVAYTSTALGWPLLAVSALAFAVYAMVRRTDVANSGCIARAEDLLAVHLREMAGLQGYFSGFDGGAQYVDPAHPYTFDMDVFGEGSLFQRINRTVTTGGCDCLARCLSGNNGYPGLADVAAVGRREKAVSALASRLDWCMAFLASGVREKVCSQTVTQSLADAAAVRIAGWAGSRAALVAACGVLVVLYALIALSVFTSVPSSAPVLVALLVLGAVLGICHGTLSAVGRAVDRLQKSFAACSRLVRHVGTLASDGQLMAASDELCMLVADVQGMQEAFRESDGLLRALDRRGNILGLVLFDIFLLSDFFLLRRVLRWQRSALADAGRWMETLSQIDALVSMAVFRHNAVGASKAEVVDDRRAVIYEARGLYHPFLGEKAVRNDFSLADRHYYIVTGANMAGKSTFLRTLGVNYILAMNGLPVFADRLRVSVFSLFSSMRTTDDLTHGISYFNAELLRLKQLLRHTSQVESTLIILDEILRGTNSADKLNGSRLFLEHISRCAVTGVIATHDLELSRMADQRPDRFHNYCFEIALGTDVTYSYRITPGVARNQNATFLLGRLLQGQ